MAQAVDKPAKVLALGCVVPKRHARRAVTRNLLRRQIRAAFVRHADALDPGLWLVRLRAGWPRGTFVSASSSSMRRTVAAELDELLREAAH